MRLPEKIHANEMYTTLHGHLHPWGVYILGYSHLHGIACKNNYVLVHIKLK